MKNILITGASGSVGRRLIPLLLDKGYRVSTLSRKSGNDHGVKTYMWNIDQGIIDEHCIDGVDTIIHLAGAGIAEKRWTDDRKKELIESRTLSIGLLYKLLKSTPNQVSSIISASAIGYYSDRGDELMTETSPPNDDFMAHCCIVWENAIDEGEQLGLRVVKLRTGVVLDKDGGALPKLALPVKLYAGSAISTGKQWIPWIHWLDVIDMYLYAIENMELKGVYNMVAPNPVTNKQLTQSIAQQLHKPLWALNVPAFILKLIMGEMSTIVLGSTKVSAQKIQNAGFNFRFPELSAALKEIYG